MESASPDKIAYEYLTQDQLFDIFKSCKANRFAKEPNFEKVGGLVSKLLDVPVTERLIENCKSLFQNDYLQYIKQSRKLKGTERNSTPSLNKFLYRKDYTKRKFEDVSPRQQSRRMSQFTSIVRAQSRRVAPAGRTRSLEPAPHV